MIYVWIKIDFVNKINHIVHTFLPLNVFYYLVRKMCAVPRTLLATQYETELTFQLCTADRRIFGMLCVSRGKWRVQQINRLHF